MTDQTSSPEHLLNLSPIEEWDETFATQIEDMKGRPLNVHGLLAHQPELLKAWWPSRMYLVQGASLGNRLGELVILRVGVHWRSWYEWAAHWVRGQQAGLTQTEVERVIAGPTHADWSEQDALILSAVDELVLEGQVSHGTLKHWAQHYSQAQLLDLIALQSMYAFLGRVLNTWPPQPEDKVKQQLPEGYGPADFAAQMAAYSDGKTEARTQALKLASLTRAEATHQLDLATLDALYDAELCYTHATGKEHNKAEYMAFLQNGSTYPKVDMAIEHISADNQLGVVTGELNIEVLRLDGTVYQGRSRVTEIWKWVESSGTKGSSGTEGSWKLWRFQSTKLGG